MQSDNINIKDILQSKTVSIKEVKLIENELTILCDQYIPGEKNQNNIVTKLLKKYNLDTFDAHPFAITNKILVLIDECNQKKEEINSK